jgi:hypothetical protein
MAYMRQELSECEPASRNALPSSRASFEILKPVGRGNRSKITEGPILGSFPYVIKQS